MKTIEQLDRAYRAAVARTRAAERWARYAPRRAEPAAAAAVQECRDLERLVRWELAAAESAADDHCVELIPYHGAIDCPHPEACHG